MIRIVDTGRLDKWRKSQKDTLPDKAEDIPVPERFVSRETGGSGEESLAIASATESYLRETPVRPLFCTSTSIQNWGVKASTGSFGRFRFIDRQISQESSPFKGCSVSRANPQRLYLVVVGAEDRMEDILYRGEVLLRNWGDGPGGSWFEVSFSQSESRDWNPLSGTDAHRTKGEEARLIAWFLDDNEERVENVGRRPVYTFSARNPIKETQARCRLDRNFQDWCRLLAQSYGYGVDPDLSDADYAAEVVRLFLGVKSRSVMSEDTLEGCEARNRWIEMDDMYRNDSRYGY